MDSLKPQSGKKTALIAGISAAVASAMVTAFMTRIVLPHFQHQNANTFEQALAEYAADFNRQMPMQVDSVTRLDRVSAGPGREFAYSYTITAMFTSEQYAQIIEELEPKVTDHVRTVPEMAEFRANKVKVIYIYHDPTGREVGRIEVLPSDQ